VGEDDLTAYVDDALSPERRALLERWLDDHPEERARLERDRALNERLRATLGPLGDAPIPDRLRVEAIRRRLRQRDFGIAGRAAAAVLLLAIGAGAGWLAHDRLAQDPQRQEIRAAITAHRIFVAEKLHPVEVTAEARAHLGTWLGNRLGRPVDIPDLSAAWLTLLGGRLLPGPNGPAGQLMYETPDRQRVTLYIEPGSGAASAFLFAEFEGAPALAWRSPQLSYVLTGPLPRDALIRIAHRIHAPG